MKKNIISYSLWGDKPIYWVGALRNIELAKEYYPGWICRFYVDKNSRKDLIETLKGDNVEVIIMDTKSYQYNNISDRFNHSGLFWRFLALSDNSIDIVLSRDCDSRISQREVDAVNEWLSSDNDFHIMRDHPYHAVPILAGMWGCRNGILSNIEELLEKWYLYEGKGRFQAEDQDFLGQFIYPFIKEKAIEHSEFNLNYGGKTRNFPYIRKDYEFVGDVFDENDVRHPDYWKIIEKMI